MTKLNSEATVTALRIALETFTELKAQLKESREMLRITESRLAQVSQEFVAYVVASTAQQAEVQRIAEELNILCADNTKEVDHA